ncbi:hypothetical protein ACEWQ7_004084 [Salmonella enterica]|nr:hypothetical protein [Salmonella enterica subsp. enterica serovar Rubislaw]
MASNSVLDVLKAMKKASAREIAARMEIDLTDAIVMLNEQKELGAAELRDGGWSLPGYREPKTLSITAKPLPAAPVLHPEKVVPEEKTDKTVKTAALISTIAAHGEQSVESLAQKHGVAVTGIASELERAVAQGVLQRNIREGRFRYGLPAERLLESLQEPVTGAEVPACESGGIITQPVEGSPSFNEGCPDDLIIPSPVEVARMIRKAKQHLRELEHIRALSMAVRKYRKTLYRLTDLKREG